MKLPNYTRFNCVENVRVCRVVFSLYGITRNSWSWDFGSKGPVAFSKMSNKEMKSSIVMGSKYLHIRK